MDNKLEITNKQVRSKKLSLKTKLPRRLRSTPVLVPHTYVEHDILAYSERLAEPTFKTSESPSSFILTSY